MGGAGRSATGARRLGGLGAALIGGLVLLAVGVAEGARPPSPLEEELLAAVREAGFDEVVDFGPEEDDCPGRWYCRTRAWRIARTPYVDVAVLQLGADGALEDAANVLLSPEYPDGVLVPIDEATSARAVRFLRWDPRRWERWEEDGRAPPGPADDLVPGREEAPLRFMAPYPASVFKLLVAFHLVRLADAGRAHLEEPVSYEGETRPLLAWLEPMITVSDNRATAALLRYLHGRGEMEALGAALADLGLETLQLGGTDPATGRRWQPGRIHMTALDTARLLWLIDGGAAMGWERPGTGTEQGRPPVRADELSDEARGHLKRLLGRQGFSEALSTTALCRIAGAEPGIPARLEARWMDAKSGRVRLGTGVRYAADARPCAAAAEVEFLHKTGLTHNYGSDAGIVRALPGEAPRHYVIVLLSNLGSRYADPAWATAARRPCELTEAGPICYTQRIAALGRRIDAWFVRQAALRAELPEPPRE